MSCVGPIAAGRWFSYAAGRATAPHRLGWYRPRAADVISETMLFLVSFAGSCCAIRVPCRWRSTAGRVHRLAVRGATRSFVQAGNSCNCSARGSRRALPPSLAASIPAHRARARRASGSSSWRPVAGRLGAVDERALGTTDIAAINTTARTATFLARAGSAGLLALAALLKSAQFPTHGWLTEVMEAPTPVSALLHAGVINAGGFLLIRFADVMLLAPGVLAVLAMVGGFTALFGALVMLTQPAVKTSLAWSTVAQMGFMILQWGWFPLALPTSSPIRSQGPCFPGLAVPGRLVHRPGPWPYRWRRGRPRLHRWRSWRDRCGFGRLRV